MRCNRANQTQIHSSVFFTIVRANEMIDLCNRCRIMSNWCSPRIVAVLKSDDHTTHTQIESFRWRFIVAANDWGEGETPHDHFWRESKCNDCGSHSLMIFPRNDTPHWELGQKNTCLSTQIVELSSMEAKQSPSLKKMCSVPSKECKTTVSRAQ